MNVIAYMFLLTPHPTACVRRQAVQADMCSNYNSYGCDSVDVLSDQTPHILLVLGGKECYSKLM